MTRRRAPEITLWVSAFALSISGGIRAYDVVAAMPNGETRPSMTTPRPAMRQRPEALRAASEALVTRDPFRLERRPSAVPYSPALESATPPPPRPPRPALAIAGIVGGPPWEALLDGVPGRQGSVLVRHGDTLGGLRIRSVTKDSVRIAGMDTTWALGVRRVWQ